MRTSCSWPALALLTLASLVTMFATWLLGRVVDDILQEGRRVTVTSVIDGDTFTATDTGGEDLGWLRVLGIDAPEMGRDGDPGECGAIKATATATHILDNATVTIAHDPTQGERDQYGRSLVYVDLAGDDFGQDMLDQGRARLYRQSATLARYDIYREAEGAAQKQDRGVWGRCA